MKNSLKNDNSALAVSPLLAATEKAARRITRKILLLSVFGSKGFYATEKENSAIAHASPKIRRDERLFQLRKVARKAKTPLSLGWQEQEIYEEARAGLHVAIAKNPCLGCKLLCMKAFPEKRELFSAGYREGQRVFRKMARNRRETTSIHAENAPEIPVYDESPFFEEMPKSEHLRRALEFFGESHDSRNKRSQSERWTRWLDAPPEITPQRRELRNFREALIFGLVGIGFEARTAENMVPRFMTWGGQNALTV